jgi:hypothetical protein
VWREWAQWLFQINIDELFAVPTESHGSEFTGGWFVWPANLV